MARNNSRFNRLLNFIGLVDESEEQGYGDGRPQGASTYNPPRKGQTNARPVRGSEFDEPRYGQQSGSRGYDDRYQSPSSGSRYPSPSRYDDYPPRQQDGYRAQGREMQYNGSRSSGAASRRQMDYDRPAQRQDGYRQSDYARSEYQPRQASGGYQPPRQPRYDEYPPRGTVRDYPPRSMPEPVREEAPPRDNVVRLREGSGRAETMIFYLHQLEECRDVITALLDNKTVLLNLEDMDERLIQRGIDTLCGAAFALNATLRKASDKTYLIAPNSVTVESSTDERY